MKQSTLASALVVLSLAACAQSKPDAAAAATPAPAGGTTAPSESAKGSTAAPSDNARLTLLELGPDLSIESIVDAPIPGFQQAVVAGQVVYVSNDGRYLLQGALYDMQQKKNLAELALAPVRKELLSRIPQSDRIVFAAAEPRYTVNVFTDAECGFCQKLHSEIAEYNRLGITVEYLAFPRMGPASEGFRLMESVWCSSNRQQALTDAKSGRPVPPKRCTSPVAMQYALGQRMGLTGTPMILAEDGTQFPGYLPPAELKQALDKLASGATTGTAAQGQPPGA